MCSLLPTSECSEDGKKSSNQRFLKGYLRPQRSTFYRVSFLFMKHLGGGILIFGYFIYPVHTRQSYIIYIEKKVKRSRQQFLVCLDLVLIDCFVTLQDLVVYGKK